MQASERPFWDAEQAEALPGIPGGKGLTAKPSRKLIGPASRRRLILREFGLHPANSTSTRRLPRRHARAAPAPSVSGGARSRSVDATLLSTGAKPHPPVPAPGLLCISLTDDT